MTHRPAVLCPIDFSEASRGALRYAWAITQHFRSRLVILGVDDPALTEARDLSIGQARDAEVTRHELAHFASRVLGGNPLRSADVEYAVAAGKPAQWIVHTAQEEPCDLIVMSTHGLTGIWKLFFGSTTERVLRETTVPVLVTPAPEEGPATLEDVRRAVGRILVPVDLTCASHRQVRIAQGLAEALNVAMTAVHVIEPVPKRPGELSVPSFESERRSRADHAVRELIATLPPQLLSEGLVVDGDPAEQIARVAKDRAAGLIVMGLHGSPAGGPRMGSVTYRVLCLAPVLLLALPPVHAGGDVVNAADEDRVALLSDGGAMTL